MNVNFMIYLLKEKGYSQTKVARELGVTSQAVSGTLREKFNSRRIQMRIAEIIGKPVEELFRKKA